MDCSSSKLFVVVALPILLLSSFLILQHQKTPTWSFSQNPNNNNYDSLHSPFPSNSSILSPPNNHSIHLEQPSPPPVIPIEALEDQPKVEKKDDSNNSDKSNWTPSINQKRLSNLEKVEAGLSRSRNAIRKAQSKKEAVVNDTDYVPKGPMYWNANAFQRSYLEMEKLFKIYVYEDGEPPVFHYSSSLGILGIEGILIHQIEISNFRTRDPEEAHVYFLPFSVLSIVSYVYVVNSRAWGPMKNTASDYIDSISRKYPYWNRSTGSDHFMLACHDWAPEISFSVPYLYKNSIRVLCNANTSEKFNPSKDVSMPEIYLPSGTTKGLIGGPSASKRPILVFYAGGIHGYIRAVLMEHWENKDPDVRIHQYLPKNVSYYGMIRKSRYCICPSGYEVASPRMVEALYMGCVPVLIKDHYVAPFSDVLNWNSFSVSIDVKDISNLKKILMGISQKNYIRMQSRGVQVRRHFEVNFPPKRYDVFHMILHSIWLRRLNIQLHE